MFPINEYISIEGTLSRILRWPQHSQLLVYAPPSGLFNLTIYNLYNAVKGFCSRYKSPRAVDFTHIEII